MSPCVCACVHVRVCASAASSYTELAAVSHSVNTAAMNPGRTISPRRRCASCDRGPEAELLESEQVQGRNSHRHWWSPLAVASTWSGSDSLMLSAAV